jgi:hypothetical protein
VIYFSLLSTKAVIGADLFPFIFEYIIMHIHEESPLELRLIIGNLFPVTRIDVPLYVHCSVLVMLQQILSSQLIHRLAGIVSAT